MFGSLVCSLVLTAAPSPKGLADAETVVWAPKLADVEQLLPFFTRAGQGSLLVAPSGWRESAHPLLPFDVTRPESMIANGLSVNDGLALSVRGTANVSCHSLSDVKRFEAACQARLERLGTFSRTERAGVVTLATRDGLNRVQAAALIKGKEACVVAVPGQSVESLLPDVLKLFAKPLSGPAVKAASEQRGPVSFLFLDRPRAGFTTLTLSAKADTLTFDGRGKALPFSTLTGAGTSPFATLRGPGVLTLRLRLLPAQLGSILQQVFSSIPGGRTLGPVAQSLAPLLTGNVALVVSRVKVTSGLRTQAARFFALKFAVLAETNSKDEARALVEAIDPKSLAFAEGTLTAGVDGATVWLSNDAETKTQTLAALATSTGTQAHGAELELDPKALAKALSSVPLLEVVQSPELSGVLVAATEVGPLLLMSKRVSGWVDSQGPGLHRGQLTWSLEPERADAGFPAVP